MILTTYWGSLGILIKMISSLLINRLALRLHPDKNKSPLAHEAFSRVNKASEYLLRPKRGKIDIFAVEFR